MDLKNVNVDVLKMMMSENPEFKKEAEKQMLQNLKQVQAGSTTGTTSAIHCAPGP